MFLFEFTTRIYEYIIKKSEIKILFYITIYARELKSNNMIINTGRQP